MASCIYKGTVTESTDTDSLLSMSNIEICLLTAPQKQQQKATTIKKNMHTSYNCYRGAFFSFNQTQDYYRTKQREIPFQLVVPGFHSLKRA